MLSIGEVAQTTGVSRRMLRHWEQLGLLQPAAVDPSTGYRRYEDSQVGRVRVVASLRSLGFGLDAIGALLDATLTEQRLVELLRARERELVVQVDEASARLAEVRSRLASLEHGSRTAMSTLHLTPLPALRLVAVRSSVRDETEIPHAVAALLARVRDHVAAQDVSEVEIVHTYDGTADDEIVVTVGTTSPAVSAAGLDVVDVDAVDEGVSVTFDERPADVADAWITLDAELARRGLRTTGVYRQATAPDGTVTLQAQVRPARE
ncbi:MerR family transcriptional regulator [Cellulomonas sp. S1-8]|uniref:MerR family transcriptional regulator n=1 Tax=Cellulomonas sp. S1-8 TaxID=2904790 RepID=UPI002244E54B|nr:MerR family transcriptional regulator [Cellulomonas sp. S1-8]UZN03661.1 MerR family transcriptional regulator [Cellulomonas sp. S1-8]